MDFGWGGFEGTLQRQVNPWIWVGYSFGGLGLKGQTKRKASTILRHAHLGLSLNLGTKHMFKKQKQKQRFYMGNRPPKMGGVHVKSLRTTLQRVPLTQMTNAYTHTHRVEALGITSSVHIRSGASFQEAEDLHFWEKCARFTEGNMWTCAIFQGTVGCV